MSKQDLIHGASDIAPLPDPTPPSFVGLASTGGSPATPPGPGSLSLAVAAQQGAVLTLDAASCLHNPLSFCAWCLNCLDCPPGCTCELPDYPEDAIA